MPLVNCLKKRERWFKTNVTFTTLAKVKQKEFLIDLEIRFMPVFTNGDTDGQITLLLLLLQMFGDNV